MDDDFEIMLPTETKMIVKGKTEVSMLCCYDVPTQYSKRMGAGCEDMQHDAISYYDISASLDAIVKVCEKGSPNDKFAYKSYKVIPGGDDYVSDHDAVKAVVHCDNQKYDLISYNLEGLCRKTVSDPQFFERLQRFQRKILKNVEPGFIMCCQEMVLQQTESLSQLADTEKKVLDILSDKFMKVKSINDGFTGCVFYDATTWIHKETIEIGRAGSKKKSNAYRFSCALGDIWVVNVHLKALKSTSIPAQFRLKDPNTRHAAELKNILDNVEKSNPNFNIPVFLCGDYNNPMDKLVLFEKAFLHEPLVESAASGGLLSGFKFW